MKKIVILTAMLLISYAAGAQNRLPNIQLEDQKGGAVQTSSLIDNETPAIISLWSTICKPCIQELDALNEMFVDWQEQANFRIIAVSVDDARSTSKAKSLAAGRGWDDFTVLYDKNQDFQRAMNVTSIPHVFIMDKNGNIVYSHNGYTPGSEVELLELLKKHQ